MNLKYEPASEPLHILLEAQGPDRTCDESKKEAEAAAPHPLFFPTPTPNPCTPQPQPMHTPTPTHAHLKKGEKKNLSSGAKMWFVPTKFFIANPAKAQKPTSHILPGTTVPKIGLCVRKHAQSADLWRVSTPTRFFIANPAFSFGLRAWGFGVWSLGFAVWVLGV